MSFFVCISIGKFCNTETGRVIQKKIILFDLFKLLCIDEIHATRIQWSSEYDGKLRQNIAFDPVTRVRLDQLGIDAFRREFVQKIFESNEEKEEGDIGDGDSLYIPRNCAGYVIGIIVWFRNLF